MTRDEAREFLRSEGLCLIHGLLKTYTNRADEKVCYQCFAIAERARTQKIAEALDILGLKPFDPFKGSK